MNVQSSGSEVVKTVILLIAGIGFLIQTIVLGANLITKRNDPNKRVEVLKGIFYLAIGAFIIANLTLFAGGYKSIIKSQKNKIESSSNESTEIETPSIIEDQNDSKNKPSFIEIIISDLLDFIVDQLKNIKEKVLKIDMKKLIFNKDNVLINFNVKLKSGTTINLYTFLLFIMGDIFLIMIAQLGIKYIYFANSVNQRVQIKDDIIRYAYVLFFIIFAPLVFKGILNINDFLVGRLELIQNSAGYDAVWNLKTEKHGILAPIAKFFMLKPEFQIWIIFIIRTIMLNVLYVFTPIAVVFWGLNKNAMAIKVWMGELITNALLPFFYSLTFIIVTLLIKRAPIFKNVLAIVVLFNVMFKIASMLRNSLQGLIARLGGLNEEGAAMGIAGSIRNIATASGISSFAGRGGGSAFENNTSNTNNNGNSGNNAGSFRSGPVNRNTSKSSSMMGKLGQKVGTIIPDQVRVGVGKTVNTARKVKNSKAFQDSAKNTAKLAKNATAIGAGVTATALTGEIGVGKSAHDNVKRVLNKKNNNKNLNEDRTNNKENKNRNRIANKQQFRDRNYKRQTRRIFSNEDNIYHSRR